MRELEEEREVLQAERERAEAKRRAAEERAVALSSQSADLVRAISIYRYIYHTPRRYEAARLRCTAGMRRRL